MDHPKFDVSNQKDESNSIQRVNDSGDCIQFSPCQSKGNREREKVDLTQMRIKPSTHATEI